MTSEIGGKRVEATHTVVGTPLHGESAEERGKRRKTNAAGVTKRKVQLERDALEELVHPKHTTVPEHFKSLSVPEHSARLRRFNPLP